MKDDTISKRDLARTEFLRTFLAVHNIDWELKSLEIDDNLYSFYFNVTILNDYIISRRKDIVYIELRDVADMSDNELDAKYELSSYALRLFMSRWDEAFLKKFKYRIPSTDYNTIYDIIKKFKTYFPGTIDYEALVQNCILDGIDLADFPDIEDVI